MTDESPARGRGGTLRLQPGALAAASALVSAGGMLLLGLAGAIGIYRGAVRMMEEWHLFFRPTVGGTLAGMVEAAVISYIFVYALARTYNAFVPGRG